MDKINKCLNSILFSAFSSRLTASAWVHPSLFIYMADFMAQEKVPNTYDYTKLFSLWKGKGSKLVSERIKPFIHYENHEKDLNVRQQNVVSPKQ